MVPPVTAATMQLAQVLTGLVFAAWLLVGVVPGVRPYANRLRATLLAIYVAGVAGFVAAVLLGWG